MPTTTIKLSEAGGHFEKLAKEMPEAAKRGLVAAGFRLVQHLQLQELPLDRGRYRADWRCTPISNGAEVTNLSDQALFIEESVRAENVKIGRAMISALSEWARRKGLAPRRGGGKGPSDPYRSMAWAIASRMKLRGIFNPPAGLHPLKTATLLEGPRYVREEVERELKRGVAE